MQKRAISSLKHKVWPSEERGLQLQVQHYKELLRIDQRYIVIHLEDVKFGEYDVSYNDVAKKLERQKMFLENLKKIEVEKPGFESSHSRFPHY